MAAIHTGWVVCNQPTQNTDFYPTLLAAGKSDLRELVLDGFAHWKRG